jgi:hypothetical protein
MNNIKMDLKEIDWEGMDLTDVTQGRSQWKAFANTAMNARFPQNVGAPWS